MHSNNFIPKQQNNIQVHMGYSPELIIYQAIKQASTNSKRSK